MIVISTKNTSQNSLAIGASFVGIGEDVSQYSSIRIAMRTTNAAPGTLFVGFSADNATWVETSYAISNPSTQAPIFVKVSNTYYRMRYVNGGTAQIGFRIQSELNGDLIAGSGLPSGSTSVNFVKQVVPITAPILAAKQVTLTSAPLNPANVALYPYHGVPQRNGVDFTVASTTLSWNGLGLDGFLDTSDTIEITYFT